MLDDTDMPPPAPRRRASTIVSKLEDCAGQFTADFEVEGPVDLADLRNERGVYLAVEAHPRGLWEPVKPGHGGDVEDRVETLCPEAWCRRVDVMFFAVYVPDLEDEDLGDLEKAIAVAVGLPEPR